MFVDLYIYLIYNFYFFIFMYLIYEMGWGKDGDVMYMNVCYCNILVYVFYYCLFITVFYSFL